MGRNISPAMSSPVYLSPLTQSPESEVTQLGSDSDHDSDSSVATLEQYQIGNGLQFGEPLRRMVRLESVDEDEVTTLNELYGFSSPRSSECSSASSASDDCDFEGLVDSYLSMSNSLLPSPHNTMKILPLQRSSVHLFILLELNLSHIRSHPWNPAPRVIHAVERGDTIYLCLEKLEEWDNPPLRRIGDYIDFFRQVLEGLTFLHEHHITGFPFSLSPEQPYSISVATSPSSDRTNRARYYFTDFSWAVHSDPHASGKNDVKACGDMMQILLEKVPPIKQKFRTLVNAMTSGEFGADDARRLFEALCKSLEAKVFEEVVEEL